MKARHVKHRMNARMLNTEVIQIRYFCSKEELPHLMRVLLNAPNILREEVKTRSQRLREAGYTRRPTWRLLPKEDDE